MELTNFLNNDSGDELKYDFNTTDLNFQVIQDDKLEKITDDITIEKTNNREKILKDLFTLLANCNDCNIVLNKLIEKYGNTQIDENIVKIIKKFSDIIGNYLITCKYNDTKGTKNPVTIKYCVFCDCKDNQQTISDNEYKTGIDGFFSNDIIENKKVIKTCKKHNLPVLAKIEDLTEEQFEELVNKVSQVKQVSCKKLKEKTASKSIFAKIKQVFSNLNIKKEKEVEDNQQYRLVQPNISATVTVDDTYKYIDVEQVNKPKMGQFEVVNENKLETINVDNVKNPELNQVDVFSENSVDSLDVKVPSNRINVKLDNKVKAGKLFTIKQNKLSDLSLVKNEKVQLKIGNKKLNVQIEKQAKMVENISIYTKPIKQFDMNDDYQIILDEKYDDFAEQQIDVKNEFNF